MGNADMIRVMAAQGYVPKGTLPKQNTLDTILHVVNQFSQINQDYQQKAEARKTKAFNMFKTLRESGYSAKKAHEVALKDYPDIPPPDMAELDPMLKNLEAKADIGYKEAQTRKTEAETGRLGEKEETDRYKAGLSYQTQQDRLNLERQKAGSAQKLRKAQISKYGAEEAKTREETKYVGEKEFADKTKTFTPEQAQKQKVGKRQVIQIIDHWGKTGQVYRDAEKDYVDMPDEESLKMFIINEAKQSPYFDLDDPNIAQSIANAVKKRFAVDLTKDETGSKVKGKSLISKVQDWLFGEKHKGQTKSDPESRYQELQSQNVPEDEIYKTLLEEGY